MTIKGLLLGSVATIAVGTAAANAADAVVAPEPEHVEYVRVCDAYGAGYFYIPGTETCLRVSGYVRYDLTGGDDVYGRGFTDRDGAAIGGKDYERKTWDNTARFTLRLSTASETELGTLKTYAETRYDWGNGTPGTSGELRYGYIELGGLRVGLDESAFVTFPGYLGNVINDDVILAGGYRTGLISYTFNAGNGFSAILSLEQGNNVDTDGKYGYNGAIKDYTPHVVGGLKYEQGWGKIAAVAAYDARNEEWAGKVRADLNITDQFSIWAMGGYKSNKDQYMNVTDGSGNVLGQVRAISSFYGTWGGDWAVWGGASFKATEKATLNAQAAYDGSSTFAATANVAYELVPGFPVTPEVSYTKWQDDKTDLHGKDAWQGMVRVQRSF
jgi:hypothetical protein